jgi:protein gp37
MAKNSKIGWTHHTANLWWGCVKVADGCSNCYACEIAEFRQHDVWGNDKPRRMIKDVWKSLGKYQKEAEELNEIHRVFVGSMMDLFELPKPLVDSNGNPMIEGIDEFSNTGQLRDRFFSEVVPNSPNLMFLLLTKRPSNINKYIPEEWKDNPPKNVMFGTSVSDQKTAKTFIPQLAKVNGKRFLSAEPLTGPIDLMEQDVDGNPLLASLHWIITGGESGVKDIRQMESEWVSVIKDHCKNNNIPFYFKQWGRDEFNPDQNDPTIKKKHPWHAKGGCMYDGKIYMNYPSHFSDDTTHIINLFDEDHFVIDQWKGFYIIDELKSYLPAMDDEIYLKLRKNIKSNGLDNQILYFENKQKKRIVIDGHSRLRACLEIGLTHIPSRKVVEKFENIGEIKLWIVKNQCERRNLSTVERLKLAFLSINEIEKMAYKNLSLAGKNKTVDKKINTCEEIGKIAGVSPSTVSRYKFVMDNFKEFDDISKTIIDNLNNGVISISKAQSLMKKYSKKNAELPDFAAGTTTQETTEETTPKTTPEATSETSTQTSMQTASDYMAVAASHSCDTSYSISDTKPNSFSKLKSSFPPTSQNEDHIPKDALSFINEATDSLNKREIEAVVILNNKNQHELIKKYTKEGNVKIIFMNLD